MNSMVDITANEQRIAERVDPKIANALAISDRAGGLQFANAGEAMEFAKMLSVSSVGVRKHLRGNPGGCLAIVVQSIEWGLSPFAVANKSYFVNDQIAFESQLIQAVILKRAPIKGRIKFEYDGDGQNRTCRAWARLRDDPDDIVDYQSPAIKDIPVKNSPLWKGDPDQQLAYYSGRALCRRHFPDVLLGIYEKEELEARFDAQGPEHARDVTPPSKLSDRLDALAAAPSREPVVERDAATGEVIRPATVADQPQHAGDPRDDDEGEGDASDSDGEPAKAEDAADLKAGKPDPAKIALIEKLRPKARQGTKKLRLVMGTISEAEEALLSQADREALEALAGEADARAD